MPQYTFDLPTDPLVVSSDNTHDDMAELVIRIPLVHDKFEEIRQKLNLVSQNNEIQVKAHIIFTDGAG